MNPIIEIFIFVAIGIAIIAEVLVAYQKYQMKKQFSEDLDRVDQSKKSQNEDDSGG